MSAKISNTFDSNRYGLSVLTAYEGPTTQSEWQSTIYRSLPPPLILGEKPKATTKVTLQEPMLQ